MVWATHGGSSCGCRPDSNSGGDGGGVTRHLFGEMPSHKKTATGDVLRITVSHVLYPVTKEVLHQVLEAYGVEKMSVFDRVNQVEAMVQLRSWQEAERARDDLHGRCIYDRCCFLDVQLVQLTTEPASTAMARRDAVASVCAPEVVVSPPDKHSASTDEPESEPVSSLSPGWDWEAMSDEQKDRCLRMVTELNETLRTRLGQSTPSPTLCDAQATSTVANWDHVVATAVPEEDYMLPLSQVEVIRKGGNITLIGWGAQLAVLEQACEDAAKDGISCELIDLKTLIPWDKETVEASVNKTGKLLVSHEAPITGGFGAEIAASITERCFQWPPPAQVEIARGRAELRPMPRRLFNCYRCDEQLKQPWPPPWFLLNEVMPFPVGMRVLAVDDDPTCLKVLENLLLRCQYHVATTGQAATALKLLREKKDQFDLVISNVHMPDRDGFKLLELVGLEMDLPDIMLAANRETQTVMKGITHGACDYLLKPVCIEQLRTIWQHVVRRRNCDTKNCGNDNDDAGQRVRAMNAEGENGGVNRNKRNSRKGRDENGDDSDENSSENAYSSTQKKPRVVWSVELHRKFGAAEYSVRHLLAEVPDDVDMVILPNYRSSVESGCLDNAVEVFKEMPCKNELSWMVMVSGFVHGGLAEDALQLFNQMRAEDVKPCDYTSAGELGALKHGKQLHAHLVQCGLEASNSAGNALLTMYAKCGAVKDARLVFLVMPNVDSVSWNAMISPLGQRGHGIEALELFDQMVAKGIYPDLLQLKIRKKGAEYFKEHDIFWTAKSATATLEGKTLSGYSAENCASLDLNIKIYGRDELLMRLQAEAESIVAQSRTSTTKKDHEASSYDSVPSVAKRVVVGFVGYPNVGKSSTINALVVQKRTGVTNTPGGVLPIDRMTKHREAIQVVVDCVPGNVLEQIYKITLSKPKPYESQSRPPTAAELLRAYGASRRYVSHSGLPDETRAARQILKDYIDGQSPHYELPPGVTDDEIESQEITGTEGPTMSAADESDPDPGVQVRLGMVLLVPWDPGGNDDDSFVSAWGQAEIQGGRNVTARLGLWLRRGPWACVMTESIQWTNKRAGVRKSRASKKSSRHPPAPFFLLLLFFPFLLLLFFPKLWLWKHS